MLISREPLRAPTSNFFGSLGIVVLFCLPVAFSKGVTRVEFSFATGGQFYRTVAFEMHQQPTRMTSPLVVWVIVHELKATGFSFMSAWTIWQAFR